MGQVQEVGSKGTPTSVVGKGGEDFVKQFNTDIRLDWMCICICTSNNHPTKPFLIFIQYISSLLEVKKRYMSALCRLKKTTREMYNAHFFLDY
jgi:hypothetical protein